MTRRSLAARLRPFGALMVLIAVAAACGGGGSDSPDALESNTTVVASAASSTTAPADGSATSSTTPATTDAPASTVAPTTGAPSTVPPTTAAPTTTAAPLTAADLVLRSDGVGPLRFGTAIEATLAALTPLLGAPAADESAAYPNEPNPGWFESVEGDYGFAHPFERHVCFSNGFCATFGGRAVEALTFVGWEYYGGGDPSLVTSDGVTVGSRWADFTGVMDVGEGGCYIQGYGTTGGSIEMTLETDGDVLFSGWDDAGNYVIFSPDPSTVFVTALQTGAVRLFLFGDC